MLRAPAKWQAWRTSSSGYRRRHQAVILRLVRSQSGSVVTILRARHELEDGHDDYDEQADTSKGQSGARRTDKVQLGTLPSFAQAIVITRQSLDIALDNIEQGLV